MLSTARSIDPTGRVGVPLKTMCSKKWATPLFLGVSSIEPTPTQTSAIATPVPGRGTTSTSSPLSNTLRTTLTLASVPAAAAAAACRRGILRHNGLGHKAAQQRCQHQRQCQGRTSQIMHTRILLPWAGILLPSHADR